MGEVVVSHESRKNKKIQQDFIPHVYFKFCLDFN